MKRAAIATLVVTVAASAHADTKAPANEPAPDGIADMESREANLESVERRNGFTFSAAAGGGILLGGDIGVGRGPALSLRLGHVATRKTVITFELTGSNGLHKEATMSDKTLADTNYALFAGAQRYVSSSLWVRGAGGPTIFVEDAMVSGGGGKAPIVGIGGLVGAGVDLARFDVGPLGYFVIALETFGMASVSKDGVKVQLAFSPISFSFY